VRGFELVKKIRPQLRDKKIKLVRIFDDFVLHERLMNCLEVEFRLFV
jgi:hypothetical protein